MGPITRGTRKSAGQRLGGGGGAGPGTLVLRTLLAIRQSTSSPSSCMDQVTRSRVILCRALWSASSWYRSLLLFSSGSSSKGGRGEGASNNQFGAVTVERGRVPTQQVRLQQGTGHQNLIVRAVMYTNHKRLSPSRQTFFTPFIVSLWSHFMAMGWAA